MKLTIIENNSKGRWCETVKFNIWKNRKDTTKAVYSKIISRKKLIIDIVCSDKLLYQECSSIIMRHIVDLIAIIFYEEECEIELIVGESLVGSDRIYFDLSTLELIKLLKEL